MAATLPLSRSAALVGSGDFGLEVCRLLVGGSSVVTPDEIEDSLGPDVETAIVAMWRPDAELCEHVDELAKGRGIAWLPVVMAHPWIRVGPWFAPERRPCYRCYARRSVQHDLQHKVTARLAKAYAADSRCGPQGFMAHHARIAAGLVRLAAETDDDRVCAYDLRTGGFTASRVLACNGCENCGLVRMLVDHG